MFSADIQTIDRGQTDGRQHIANVDVSSRWLIAVGGNVIRKHFVNGSGHR